ncbi:MarR family transcriptional regulator [Candidatus Peregrinibacteria bacterium]|nr:MarR family transcriptional regulator [Candidatus Peregrinibacteria bacterium]
MEQEDYLETIYKIAQTRDYVRVSDLAKELGLSKPSVTQMIQRLQKEGYIIHKAYEPLKLTKKGKLIGQKVAERHEVLAEFFTLLEIPKRIQEKDIHGIEHHLSPITLKKLRAVTKRLNGKKF